MTDELYRWELQQVMIEKEAHHRRERLNEIFFTLFCSVFFCAIFLLLFVGVPYAFVKHSEAEGMREEAVKHGYAEFSDKHEFRWKNEVKNETK